MNMKKMVLGGLLAAAISCSPDPEKEPVDELGYTTVIDKNTGVSCNDLYKIENATLDDNFARFCDVYTNINTIVESNEMNKSECLDYVSGYYNRAKQDWSYPQVKTDLAIQILNAQMVEDCARNAKETGINSNLILESCKTDTITQIGQAYLDQKSECFNTPKIQYEYPSNNNNNNTNRPTYTADSVCLNKVNPSTGISCLDIEKFTGKDILYSGTPLSSEPVPCYDQCQPSPIDKINNETCKNIVKYNELTGLSGYSAENIIECQNDIALAKEYLEQNRLIGGNEGQIDGGYFRISLNLLNKKRLTCSEEQFAKGLRGKEITDICGSGDGIEWNEPLARAIKNQYEEECQCRMQN